MKNKINYIVITILLSIFSLVGCYDDKSKFADNSIEEVIIDTTGIDLKQYVGYQEQLDLAPTITPNFQGLKYQWILTEQPNSRSEFEVISTEKELHYTISRPISTNPYYLQLTVTDTNNSDLQYICLWRIYVQGTFNSGLIVTESKDETSDFTYIKNSTVSENYHKEEKVYRHILTTSNGTPYQGVITSLAYQCFSNKTNQVWAITNKGFCSRFDCLDFSENGNSNTDNLMPFKPTGLEFISFFKGSQRFFANTSNGIYGLSPNAANLFSTPDGAAKGYSINNNIYANNTDETNSNDYVVWLDKSKGQFIAYHSPGFNQFTCESYKENSIFNPNNLPNKSAIAAITSENGQQTIFCLKDDKTGEYTIYTLANYINAVNEWNEALQDYVEVSPAVEAKAQNKYNIPTEGKSLLDQAVSTFFAKKENVLYVATPNGIYAIIFGMGDTATVNTVAKYSPASGEKITLAKLFQQGYYARNSDAIIGSSPSKPLLPWSNKAIIIATQKSDSEGKVHIIPMTQLGTGNLDSSQALIYGGFNKINDIITISY